jgi:hypothetical protein
MNISSVFGLRHDMSMGIPMGSTDGGGRKGGKRDSLTCVIYLC